MKEVKKFLDLKVPVFVNKKNGQMSVTLPRKKIKNLIKEGGVPEKMRIGIFSWKK